MLKRLVRLWRCSHDLKGADKQKHVYCYII